MIAYSTYILYHNIYLTYIVPYSIANVTRLKLSAEQVTQLTGMLTTWTPAMEKYLNQEKHGTLSENTINAFSAVKIFSQ